MTPFGHISINYLTSRWVKKLDVRAMVVGALLPDIDWVFFFLHFFNQLHRSITHNLFFVLIISVLISLFFKRDRFIIFISLVIGQLLHLSLDSIIDTNSSNGIGIQLFWPFNPMLFSPFNLAKITNKTQDWSDPIGMIKISLPYFIFELPFIIIALYLIINRKFRKLKAH